MASAELMDGLGTDRAARRALGGGVTEIWALASRTSAFRTSASRTSASRAFAPCAVRGVGLCNLDAQDGAGTSLAAFVDVTLSCAVRNDPTGGPFGQVAAVPQHRASVQRTAGGQESVGGRCAE
jgi:hypothetical protein